MTTSAGSQQAVAIHTGHRRPPAVKPTSTTTVQTPATIKIMPRTPRAAKTAASHTWKSQCKSIQGRSAEPKVNGSSVGTFWLCQIHCPARTCHQTSASESSWQPSANAAAAMSSTRPPSASEEARRRYARFSDSRALEALLLLMAAMSRIRFQRSRLEKQIAGEIPSSGISWFLPIYSRIHIPL